MMQITLHHPGKTRARIAFLSLLVFTILLSFGANFISGLRKHQESGLAPDPPTFLNARGPKTDDALSQRPLNKLSRIVAMADRAADETSAAAAALLTEIEPTSVPKDIDLGAATRDELDALRRGLKTAEVSAATLLPRYLALLKSEHDKVESYARSLDVEKDFRTRLLAAIDKRHMEIATLISQMLMARADFYRGYETYVALLVAEYGTYKVVNGQFIFPIQRTVDRYNIAAHAMAVAAKRVEEHEEEQKRLMQLQQQQWRQFVESR
jgi:hypothetical protein